MNWNAKNAAGLLLATAIAFSPAPPAHAQSRGATLPRDSLIAAARELMNLARYAALITLDQSGKPRVRTMDPFAPDDDMVIWLGTNRQTRKVAEIRNHERVALYYAHPDNEGYVSLYGTARLVDDPREKARRWKEEWGQFYPDREASYLLIAVEPEWMEIIHYTRGIDGDSVTWRPPAVRFQSDDPAGERRTTMAFIVVLTGLFIIAVGVVGTLRPRAVIAPIQSWRPRGRLSFAVSIRLILGVAFIIAAPSTRFPTVILALGIVAIVAALALLAVGAQRLDAFIHRLLEQPHPALRLWFAAAILFGAFLVYSGA